MIMIIIMIIILIMITIILMIPNGGAPHQRHGPGRLARRQDAARPAAENNNYY